MDYFRKMRGTTQSPPRVALPEVLWSWVGAVIGIALVGLLHARMVDQAGQALLIGSFGATAVLVYGAIRSPLAQPRNVLGGHVLSAIIGVCAQQTLGATPWLAAAVAVATTGVAAVVAAGLPPLPMAAMTGVSTAIERGTT